MFTIKVDIAGLTQSMQESVAPFLDQAVDVLGEYALDRITSLAAEKLDAENQAKYSKALKTRRTPTQLTISLEDEEVERLEDGVTRFDIKPGLLSGRSAKQSKSGGTYADVPFQHRTTKRGTGTYIGNASMRGAVNKAVKAVKAGGATRRLFQSARGAQRTKQTDMTVSKGAGGTSATTFRRISDKSDPSSWIHPGSAGLKILETVAKEINNVKDSIIADMIKRTA